MVVLGGWVFLMSEVPLYLMLIHYYRFHGTLHVLRAVNAMNRSNPQP